MHRNTCADLTTGGVDRGMNAQDLGLPGGRGSADRRRVLGDDDDDDGRARGTLIGSIPPRGPAPTAAMAADLRLAQRVFHVGALLYYVAVDVNIVVAMEEAYERVGRPKDDPVVRRMLAGGVTYFTAWNLMIHQIYFSLCCTEYLLEFFPKALSPAAQDKLRTVRRIMLPVFLFPCSCEVVFNYWTLYLHSPRLVFGDFLDAINPMWINHAIHTFIVPVSVLEMFIRVRSEGIWDGGFYADVNKLNALFTFYLVTVLVGYHRRGTWPYPFMDPMNGKMFAGMVALCYIMGWTWFYVGRCLIRILSGRGEATRLISVGSPKKTK